jgi:hypothetical protein
MMTVISIVMARKKKIPVAFKEQIWLRQFGTKFQGKCPTSWCKNTISVFDFHAGHKIAESKGGPTSPDNLIPLCARCNTSMGVRTFEEWSNVNNLQKVPLAENKVWWCCF